MLESCTCIMEVKGEEKLQETENEMIADYVASRQAAVDPREMQEIAVEYYDQVFYQDKVYYYRNYSFEKDIQMILCMHWVGR